MFNDFDLVPVLPEMFLVMVAMGLLLVGLTHKSESALVINGGGIVAFAIAILILFKAPWSGMPVFHASFLLDSYAGLLKLMILLGGMASLALSGDYLRREGLARFEYPILVMFAVVGMMLMVSANNLLSLYMGLELQSLSLYVLAAFRRNSLLSAEAGVKYFSLGALSSGMLLFGSSLIYGFTGSLDFDVIAQTVLAVEGVNVGMTFALVFMLAGLAFKVSAVPFHMWTPDVYQGAPTSVTALFAIVPKVAAMGLLIRLLYGPFGAMADQWGQIIWALAAASMIVGAFAAIAQSNIKRLMAYSSIGHMGYALIAVAASGVVGVGSVLIYLFIYMVMSAGAFAVILSLRRGGVAAEKISDLSGLSQSHPAQAYSLAILMFSMSGIPPLAGFFGKLVVFQAAVDAQMYILATLGVLSSVVAAYYYLRIIKVMFFDALEDSLDDDKMPLARRAVLSLSILFVVLYVAKPSALMLAAQEAAASLF